MNDLIKAYKQTDYLVPEFDLCIKIDQCSEDLRAFCEKRKVESWAFITAHNPYSKLLNPMENEARNQSLEQDLLDYDFFHGLGRGKDSDWPIENSFFVLNISLEEAVLLAKKHQQNAIVYGLKNSEAKLILNRDFE
ncbi:DUF3293 domain-containing protein [Lentisphaera marina]|uniref:DUF3293 domain-containing protein n=1 Tax=Lentisphaera marina TaxID=1111041 RepID=UPI00236575D1|nr:DUF3293 domain-containing protein [Lentisphaera marina]MDD7986073.1 DUF3293 domain-containing protein [Lentisphaera marina]